MVTCLPTHLKHILNPFATKVIAENSTGFDKTNIVSDSTNIIIDV